MNRLSKRPLPLALALAIAFSATTLHAQVSGAAPMQISIAAQPLAQALNDWARQTRLQLVVQQGAVAGKTAPAVAGSLSPRESLDRLLAGSGLFGRFEGNLVTVEPMPRAGESTTLNTVTVTAQAERGSTTEGTGSYAATGPVSAATGLGLTLRETPQSVSVLTRQQIEDQNLTTLGEAVKNITGIATTSSDSDRTDLHSRGFYVDNYQYDGVTTANTLDFFGASTLDPVLYDRIEVVRGATGLLTGAGQPGASVNLVRKRASSKVFTGSASLGIGSWGHHRGTLDLSAPLSADGRVRGRIATMTEERGSHLDRYETRNRALLATVEVDLTPSTTLRVGVEHQAKRPSSVTWGGLPMVFTDGSPTHWPRSFSIGADWTTWNTTSDTVFAGLEHQFDNGWSLKAHASRLESEYDTRLIYMLGQPDRVTGLGVNPYANRSEEAFSQNTASVQATGPFELFGRRHEAVVGATGSQSRHTFGSYANTASAIGNLLAWDGRYPEPVWGSFNARGEDRASQSALYGVLRLSLTDSLKFMAGARQTRWKTKGWTTQREHDEFTPYAGLVYDVDSFHSVYASYTDIFQPQDNRDVSGAYLDPVVGKSYEVGAKGAYLDGQLNASLALFRIEQDNVAVIDGSNLVPGTTANAYRGAKGVTSKGIEVEVAGELAKGWQVATGFSRTLAQEANGQRLSPRRPRNQLHLFTSYRLQGGWNKLTLGAGVQWRGSTYETTTTSTGVAARRGQGAIAIASLMASYAFTPRVSAQLNISNLFDKTYFDFAGSQIYYGAPRKSMLTVSYKF